MNINWKDIKTEILAETKDILQTDNSIKINKIIDLFEKVLIFPVQDADLEGISTRMPNALQKILLDNLSRLDKNSFFPNVAKFEQFLRKVLFIVDNRKYQQIKNTKSALSSVIRALDLNPNNVDFNWTTLNPNQKTHFAEHLIKSYNLRNIESHVCKEWNNAKLYDELRSLLVLYLYTVHRHYRKLKQFVEPYDLTSYLQKQINIFNIWKKRFVHIEGKEEFAEIDLYAKELFEDDENDADDFKSPREGKIDDLRKNISEKQLVILGEVGSGKSTTLQYLHYQDAKTAINNKEALIPLYFELKNFTDKENLEQKIVTRLNIDKDFVSDILKTGKLSIFFDGLNEIEKNYKAKAFTQIRNLIAEYPNNHFLFTSRPQGYNREFDDLMQNRKIPVFVLQKMENNQISEFLDKNGKQVKNQIQKEIDANERLKKIVQTPLMLIMLIAVVKRIGKIPSEKGKIIRAFILSLYEREQKQIIDFDKDVMHLMLCYLGYETRSLTGANSGLDRNEYILPILEERKKQLGIATNLIELIKKAVDLNILVNDENQYSFTHEMYQEYYAAEYIHQFRKSKMNE